MQFTSFKLVSFSVLFAALTACGGGGGGEQVVNVSKPPATETQKTVSGGTPSAPASIGLGAINQISVSSFNNYFKYTGVAGERLVLRANLSVPLSDVQNSRCGSSPSTGTTPSAYDTQIHVYSPSGMRVDGICGEDLTYTFSESGERTFNFEFPSNGPGFFNAATLVGNTPVRFQQVGSGSPVEPKAISTTSANSIGTNVFNNYYWIPALKGELIVVSASLNQPLTSVQKSRCSANPGAYRTQIIVYNAQLTKVDLVCGENIRFFAPENGNYVFQFNYGSQSAGVFNASKS